MAEYNGRTKAEACACCTHADPRVLVRRRVGVEMQTLCANCAAILGRRPITLDELRAEVLPPNDRRQSDRRRGADRRAALDRRHLLDVTKMLDDDRRSYGGRRANDAAA